MALLRVRYYAALTLGVAGAIFIVALVLHEAPGFHGHLPGPHLR
ncbi:MAG: hypothetical protein ABUL77_02910 [Bacteroidota bacterium]